MEVYFLDSNVFFYAKILDRQYGAPCADILRNVEEGKIRAITSALTIIEFANALRKYGLGDEVKEVIDATFSLDFDIYDIDTSDVRNAMDIFDEYRISLYDSVHVAVMKRAGTNCIISADKDFDKVVSIKRVDPKMANLQLER